MVKTKMKEYMTMIIHRLQYINVLLVLKKKEMNINILAITNLNKVIILNINIA